MLESIIMKNNKKVISKDEDTKSMIKELASEVSENRNKKIICNISDEQIDNILDDNILDDNIINNNFDEISELQENISSKTKNIEKGENVSDEFTEKVLTYTKCDNLIRDKKAEIKVLNNQKELCGEYIIKYLDEKGATFVNINNGKLVKSVSESKVPLKLDVIKEAIMEGIKGEQITDDVKSNDIIAKIVDLMERKRAKKVKVNLRRTFQRNKKLLNKKKKLLDKKPSDKKNPL